MFYFGQTGWRCPGWMAGGGESLFGYWVSCGYQVSSKRRAFLRSAIGLAIVLYLAGIFTPQKVSLINMRTYNVPFQLI